MTAGRQLPGAFRGLARRLRRLAELDAADVGLFVHVVSVGATVPLFLRLPLTRQAALLAPGDGGYSGRPSGPRSPSGSGRAVEESQGRAGEVPGRRGAEGWGRARAQRGRRRLEAERAEDVARLTQCVELAQDIARPLVRSGCLTRGIVLYWFLGRGDEEIELCFGLGHPGDRVEYSGHCWLTRRGEPFLEPEDPRTSFSLIYRIPLAVSSG